MNAIAHLARHLAPTTAVVLLTLTVFGATSAVHQAGTAGAEVTTGITTTSVHVAATLNVPANNGWD